MPVEVCQVSSEIIVDVTKTISSPTQASIYEYILNFTYDGFHKHALRFMFHVSFFVNNMTKFCLIIYFGTQESCYLGSMILDNVSFPCMFAQPTIIYF